MLDTYFWLNFIINLIATFIIYSGPILIYRVIKKGAIEAKAAKKICLIYGVFSFILMSCLISLIHGTGAATATIVLYYWLNKWILTHQSKNESPCPYDDFSQIDTFPELERGAAQGELRDCSVIDNHEAIQGPTVSSAGTDMPRQSEYPVTDEEYHQAQKIVSWGKHHPAVKEIAQIQGKCPQDVIYHYTEVIRNYNLGKYRHR